MDDKTRVITPDELKEVVVEKWLRLKADLRNKILSALQNMHDPSQPINVLCETYSKEMDQSLRDELIAAGWVVTLKYSCDLCEWVICYAEPWSVQEHRKKDITVMQMGLLLSVTGVWLNCCVMSGVMLAGYSALRAGDVIGWGLLAGLMIVMIPAGRFIGCCFCKEFGFPKPEVGAIVLGILTAVCTLMLPVITLINGR